ncbi:MAG: NAD-dependent epimerase/dehydratase family protein [Nitrososphaerales archaeon]
MKVLVTGGCGFIGSHLVRSLIERGYNVIIFDNFSHASCLGVDGATLIKGDVRFKPALENALNGVDAVYHLAALTDVRESVRKPLLYHKVNSDGTLNVLECCRRVGVKNLIYTSSCAVYGEPVKLPIDEEHPLKPLSPYAASKLCAEAFCRSYASCYDVNVTVFRLFNVYGPRQSDHYAGVISEFVKRVKGGKPPVIYGSGEQSRDFIYVGDVVDCLIRALESEQSGFELLNLGSGKAVKVNELAEHVLKLIGNVNLSPIRKPAKRFEIFASCADTSRVEKKLNFKPKKSIVDGLTELLRSYS